jgi:hypothetical protein
VGNDDVEITVESQSPIVCAAGESWRVRHRLDGHVWEFETSAVGCEDGRLVLNHGEQVRVAARGRSDCAVVNAPAAVARFPFIQSAAKESPGTSPEAPRTEWFELIHAVVTEVSGSHLQIKSPLDARMGERILVMFVLAPAAVSEQTADSVEPREHIIGHVGRVRNRQAAGADTLLTVDLAGLVDVEIDKLVRLARAAASPASGGQSVGPGSREAPGARMMQGA